MLGVIKSHIPFVHDICFLYHLTVNVRYNENDEETMRETADDVAVEKQHAQEYIDHSEAFLFPVDMEGA